MKQALISPDEITLSYDGTPLGMRVAMVADNVFEVALPLFWVECADDVAADQFYWDGSSCVAKPQPAVVDHNNQVGPNVVA